MKAAKTYGLTHLSIAVKDIKRTLKFYQDVFDMEVMYRKEKFIQLNTPGSHDVLVFEQRAANKIGNSGGIAHFGFRLKNPDDIHDIIVKAIKAGAVIIKQGDFAPGSTYVFFKDPDGYEVEVWYEL